MYLDVAAASTSHTDVDVFRLMGKYCILTMVYFSYKILWHRITKIDFVVVVIIEKNKYKFV